MGNKLDNWKQLISKHYLITSDIKHNNYLKVFFLIGDKVALVSDNINKQ